MKNIVIKKSITNYDTDSFGLYLKDVAKTHPLSLSEEQELARRIHKGDKEAFDKLVTSNLRFVITVAKQYQGQGVPLSDLIQEGSIGITKAAMKYDETRGFKFISYAVWWIRQAILLCIYNQSRTVRYSNSQIVRAARINKARAYLKEMLGRDPTNEEVANEVKLTVEQVEDVDFYKSTCSSLDTPLSDKADSDVVGDLIPGDIRTDKLVEDNAKRDELYFLISKLDTRKADVLRMFFGLGCAQLSFIEIGKRFGITGERARQLKESALETLKRRYSSKLKELL
jgi:RNA polymerase primary sigma factor